ncbi:hypothetical protein [Maribacter sp. MAR_2009_72]|uniref:hypothetical protein n=1 Tax=Maribacter sp. MAR_2009_72 TaxID=1250050 RepID=UPI001198ED14|nr:hypothetical protein [Maribacter sp. MAR_2009_72]TVZ15795.1 hypothetical protein JM81_2047 [Maribacter sp. MAR_2009_72]
MKKSVLLSLMAIGIMCNVSAMNVSEIANNKIVINNTDEYVKIKSSELTPPVIEEILKQYPTSKLGAAYKNNSGEFKLVMVLKSGTRRTVYIDQYGNWINKK